MEMNSDCLILKESWWWHLCTTLVHIAPAVLKNFSLLLELGDLLVSDTYPTWEQTEPCQSASRAGHRPEQSRAKQCVCTNCREIKFQTHIETYKCDKTFSIILNQSFLQNLQAAGRPELSTELISNCRYTHTCTLNWMLKDSMSNEKRRERINKTENLWFYTESTICFSIYTSPSRFRKNLE